MEDILGVISHFLKNINFPGGLGGVCNFCGKSGGVEGFNILLKNGKSGGVGGY